MKIGDADKPISFSRADRILLASRIAYHLRCLREDATDPVVSSLERLALVRDCANRIREIMGELEEQVVAAALYEEGGTPPHVRTLQPRHASLDPRRAV